MKSIKSTLVVLLCLGFASCQKMEIYESTNELFLNEDTVENIQNVNAITDKACYYEVDNSFYNLNPLRDNNKYSK